MIGLLRKLAAKHLLEPSRKPTEVKDLKFAFVDSNGLRYYKWANVPDLPKCRLDQLYGHVQFANACISKETLQELTTKISELHFKTIDEKNIDKRTTMHSKIQALLTEISERGNYITPESTTYEMAAVTCCREDENPNGFDQSIQEEKTQQFRKEMRSGNHFFLQTPIMKDLLSSLVGTEEMLTRLLAKWAHDQRLQTERMKVILSDVKSKSTTEAKKS